MKLEALKKKIEAANGTKEAAIEEIKQEAVVITSPVEQLVEAAPVVAEAPTEEVVEEVVVESVPVQEPVVKSSKKKKSVV